MGLGVLSACASQVEQSRPPATPVAASASRAQAFETEWRRAAAASPPDSAADAWEQAVNTTIERAYGTALDTCVPQHDAAGPADASRMRFVLDVALDGSVRQVWSESDSSLEACVRASLGEAKFASAPYDGYRLGLVFDLSDTPGPGEIFDMTQLPRVPRPAPGPISPDDAKRTAIRDTGTREGQAYMHSFAAWFGEAFNPLLVQCMAIPLLESEQALRGYRLIIEVAADGATRRVLVVPEPEMPEAGSFQSPRAHCLRDGLSRAALQVPPWDGFWLLLGLDNPPPGASLQ